jgi:hypothetical protein
MQIVIKQKYVVYNQYKVINKKKMMRYKLNLMNNRKKIIAIKNHLVKMIYKPCILNPNSILSKKLVLNNKMK